jgi:DNA-binding SARP family transcriptional activator/tetratricopeptide (TPR) repeat protein
VHVRFRILGPLEIVEDGRLVDVPAARDRVLLATLLLEPNRVVPVTRLVEAIWGASAPTTARAQLHTCVSRLRRRLPDRIRTRSAGYTIAASAEDLDARTFTVLTGEARRAMVAGDLVLARERFRTALGLWRGAALVDVDSRVVQAGATVLEEQHSAAAEDCIDVELRLGHERELVGELTELVERYPLRERLAGQLMTTLSRVGRQVDALAVFRRIRQVLRDELGLEPGPELQKMQRMILSADPALRTPGTTEPAPLLPGMSAQPDTTATVPRSLPRDVPDFAGRHDTLRHLLGAVRVGSDPVIVAVDGMAGIGKTTLAVHLAHQVAGQYPGGQLFVDLHAHSDRAPLTPGEALRLLLGQLRVDPARVGNDLDSLVALWRSELAGRRVLIVLDNAADAAQVRPLLPGGSASLTVVTSRRRLVGLDGIHPVSLDVLAPEEAVRLLSGTVGTRIAAEPDSAAEVARLCGYLPLALRLAAARLAHRTSWTVADLAGRLARADPPPVDLAVEGRSASAAFALSYRHLYPPARRMFRLLGLHPGGSFGLPAAAALADVSLADADALLAELVDAHLIGEPAAGRFRAHDLLRDYASRLSAEDPERLDGLRRLLDHYLQATVRATNGRELSSTRGVFTFAEVARHLPAFDDDESRQVWLEAEWPNVVAVAHLADALGWHRHTCLFARAVWIFLFRRSMNEVSIDLHTRALRAAVALDDAELEAMTHNYLASALGRSGRWGEALEHLHRARTHPAFANSALLNIASVNLLIGRYADVLRLLETALSPRLFAELREYQVLYALGVALRMFGRYDECLVVTRRCVANARRRQLDWAVATAIKDLGVLRQRLGQHRHAATLLSRALAATDETIHRAAKAEILSHLGTSLWAVGQPDRALTCLRRAYEEAVRIDPPITCLTANNLAFGLLAAGEHAEAERIRRVALATAERTDSLYELARAHSGIGDSRHADGDQEGARHHWRQALALFEQMGTPERHDLSARLNPPPHPATPR